MATKLRAEGSVLLSCTKRVFLEGIGKDQHSQEVLGFYQDTVERLEVVAIKFSKWAEKMQLGKDAVRYEETGRTGATEGITQIKSIVAELRNRGSAAAFPSVHQPLREKKDEAEKEVGVVDELENVFADEQPDKRTEATEELDQMFGKVQVKEKKRDVFDEIF